MSGIKATYLRSSAFVSPWLTLSISFIHSAAQRTFVGKWMKRNSCFSILSLLNWAWEQSTCQLSRFHLCVCVCVRACVCACVRACVRASVRASVRAHARALNLYCVWHMTYYEFFINLFISVSTIVHWKIRSSLMAVLNRWYGAMMKGCF